MGITTTRLFEIWDNRRIGYLMAKNEWSEARARRVVEAEQRLANERYLAERERAWEETARKRRDRYHQQKNGKH